MTLSTNDAIQRFGQNEERVDTFVNQTGSYQTNGSPPQSVETLPSLMNRLQQRYLNIVDKGDWTTAAVYVINDIAKQSNVIYLCVTPHTAGTFLIDLAAGKWVVYQGITSKDLQFDVARQETANNGFAGLQARQCAFMLLGDSISEGAGASAYVNGCSWQAARSLLNAGDMGWPNERTYGYHTVVNMANAVASGLISHNGLIVNAGVVGSRISLAAGQAVTLTGVSVDYSDVVYDASASSGSIEIAINNVVRKTVAISGTGLKDTFPTTVGAAYRGYLTSEADSITFTAVGGTVVICGVLAWRTAYLSPAAWVVAKSGTAYQDYTSSTQLDELAYWLNLYRTSSAKYMILNLGTNNIYNSSKSLSPSSMVAQISTLINGISSRCVGVQFAIAVPPRAVESTWPVIASGYTYDDYVKAIVEFARSNQHALVRHDKSTLGIGNSAYYSDGVHPNNAGHAVAAKNLCDTMGVMLNPNTKGSSGLISPPKELINIVISTTVDIVMNDTWRAFTNNAAFAAKATKQNNVLFLSGIVEKNGSTSTTVGTLPVGYRPAGRNTYVISRNDAGVTTIDISSGGVITVSALPTTWLSLENIALVINR